MSNAAMHGLAILCVVASLARFASAAEPAVAGTLEALLAEEDPAALAQDARRQGDAARGAVLFYHRQLACAKCHVGEVGGAAFAPDLTKPEQGVTDAHLIEAILAPSKAIRKGFETIAVTTHDGVIVTGLLVEERSDAIVVRDLVEFDRTIAVPLDQVDERATAKESAMPAGLANLLGGRQEFLDLAKYVIEVAEQGPSRAAELRPPVSLFAAPVPDYEREIDHAGMIASFDDAAFERGEAIYNRLCVNCHGTRERPGSLPTSLRFASGRFKSGGDPYGIYRTLTYGFGQMTPQTWMVPTQKYDVIHYVREAYLKELNPSQYSQVTGSYLAGLPKGTSRGPEPSLLETWVTMNYGPHLAETYEVGDDGSNFAYKGIAIRLDDGPGGVSRGRHWMLFDHDTLRVAAAWSGEGFIDFNGISFNGLHESHPRLVGDVQFANPMGPGWANPVTGGFDDARLVGRDGRRYGPLPRDWAHYRGLYHFGERVIIAYTVGGTEILEMPGIEQHADQIVFTRTLHVGAAEGELLLRVAPSDAAVALVGDDSCRLIDLDGSTLARFPPSREDRLVKLLLGRGTDEVASHAASSPPPVAFDPLTKGGPRRWPEILTTQATLGEAAGPFAVDVLTPPTNNPWLCQMRLTGLDFFADGDSVAACTWDGDVWLVRELSTALDPAGPGRDLTWQRIASGLFQPLGLKIVAGRILVTCRDQIVALHDLNGDGETDFYENFNSDHQVTEHFHEFAMGLQTDAAGDFYYCKSARHALPALVPQHGTLLRVAADGSRTDIVAQGFRAANGVCVNPDGTFFVTDQEGHWNPKNRLNWVHEGGFYGNMWGYHDVTDTSDAAMEQPICWITNDCDRSPAEMLWVPPDAWGPLADSLLNLSYGYGKVFVVPHEIVGGQMQGGMCELPIPQFPTGIIRGRFSPVDRQLYVCGMFAWAGNQTEPGGFYRIRHTGKPAYLPIALSASRDGLSIGFSGPLDSEAAGDPRNYRVKVWSLKRTANYGSEHHDERPLAVAGALLEENGRTVRLTLPEFAPTWCMEIRYTLRAADGTAIDGTINNTVHALGD